LNRDAAPDIFRQRLPLEGYRSIRVDENAVEEILMGASINPGD